MGSCQFLEIMPWKIAIEVLQNNRTDIRVDRRER